MRRFTLALCAVATITVPAFANERPDRELGYARGALGYEALMRADYSAAEQQIEARNGVTVNDPARLLNLANVYLRTGRIANARALFEAVRDHRRHFALEMANGAVMDSREVARIALERMGETYAAR